MHIYTTGQWVLLFFFYCFCGWVWESCYVSVCQRRWVNRGFLHGPLLPIYGSGAILILFVTLPAANHLWLVYVLGLVAATALEYVTGAVMERLFGVRYWDYSKHWCNLNGYICLSSSIAWGFFSVLLVRFIHPPVGRLLADVPSFLVDPAALVLTIAFTVDVVRSTQEALDLREMLTRLAEENEDIRRLARRAEVAAAFAGDDLRRFRERTEVEKLLLQNRIESELAEQREAHRARKLRRREAAQERIRRRAEAKLQALANIAQTLEMARNNLENVADAADASLESRRADLDECIARLRRWEGSIRSRSENVYRRSLRILENNPTARARQERGEVLEALRRLLDR